MLCEEDKRLRNSIQSLECFVLNAKEHYGETFYVHNIHERIFSRIAEICYAYYIKMDL